MGARGTIGLVCLVVVLAALPSAARAQGVYFGYGIPLDGASGGIEAGGGFGWGFGPLGIEGRLVWSDGGISTAFPGQISPWLRGNFLRLEALGSYRFLDDWIRPYVIAGPVLGPLALRSEIQPEAAPQISAHSGGGITYQIDDHSMGFGGGLSAGGGVKLWFGQLGLAAEVRLNLLFASATVRASSVVMGAGPSYVQSSDATLHQIIFRIGILYGGFRNDPPLTEGTPEASDEEPEGDGGAQVLEPEAEPEPEPDTEGLYDI